MVHAAFDHAEPQWEKLNVIVRAYAQRGKLDPHVDRPDLFEEDVCGCILENTTDVGLTRHAPEVQEWGNSKMAYKLPEKPGL